MTPLRPLALRLVRSRWFLAYCALNLLDKAAALVPEATVGKPPRVALGGLVMIGSVACFFLLLAEARTAFFGGNAVSAPRVFVARWLVRLRLGILAIPFAIVLFATGQDEAISNVLAREVEGGISGQGQEPSLAQLASLMGPWVAIFLAFYCVDICSAGVVTAQGHSRRALRNAATLLLQSPLLALAVFAAEVVTGVLGYAGKAVLLLPMGMAISILVIALLTIPLTLLIQVGGAILLGDRFARLGIAGSAPSETPQ